MLFADKRALQTNLKLELLEIREKELNFYTTNCGNLAFLSSIFAGFASTALMTHVSKTPPMLHFMYLFSTVCALGLQLSALVSTTLLAMLAPGLALRGPDGSMNAAIDSMIGEYRTAFFMLLLGLLALHASVTFFAWLQFPLGTALIETVLVLISLSVEVHYIRRTFADFRLPSAKVVTGRFEGAEAIHAGQDAGLRDKGEIRMVSGLIRDQGTAGVAPQLG